MIGFTFYRKLAIGLAALTILFVLIISAVFVDFKSHAQSKKSDESSTRWLTVDEKELSHIQNIAQQKGDNFDLKIVERRDNLLIVAADETQMLELSRRMHNEFQKCGGFFFHQTEEAARRSIDESSLRANANLRAVEYTINNPQLVASLHAEAQEAQIRETIIRLSTDFPSRRYNLPSGVNSANWIKNKWTQLAAGRRDVTVEFFNHSTDVSLQPSIVMTVRGTTLPDEVIVVGGHQDSVNWYDGPSAPGADDDASGIASMTEAIRVLMAKNFHPQRTIKFMAYAAEEVGLRGSSLIADDFLARGINVVGVLQLDMTNFKSAASTVDIAIITDNTNAAQNQFLRDLIAFYQPTLVVADSTCGYGCSDHASWHGRGFPASFPFEAGFQNSNPHIHTSRDTIAQSGDNANHALKFTRLALSYLGELAKETIGISGTILYGNSPANEPQKFVPGVAASISSAPSESATTDAAGFYLIKNLARGGAYSVTLSKTGNVNGITAFDATLVLRHVAANGQGVYLLNENQQRAADTDSDREITSFDAVQILRFVAAGNQTPQTGAVGQWKFTPPSRSYTGFSGFDAEENYTALLVGELDGDWSANGF